MSYSQQYKTYIESGIGAPLPIPAYSKTPPPSGFTGQKNTYPVGSDYLEWKDHTGNLALWLFPGVVGLDIDTYDKVQADGTLVIKNGIQTLKNLESYLGALPDTVISSSRQNPKESGIRLYRVPEYIKFKTKLESDIEIIQPGHRYALVYPSTVGAYTQTGMTELAYQWYTAKGKITTIPVLEDLPELPESWVRYLRDGYEGPVPGRITRFQKAVYHPRTLSEATTWYNNRLEKFNDVMEGGNYNSALYGFSRDYTAYHRAIGQDDFKIWDGLCATVQRHSQYQVWGAFDHADHATMRSGYKSVLEDEVKWALEAEFDPFNPQPDPNFTLSIMRHLWKDKLVNRAYNTLAGPGSVGKSLLYVKLAAKISKGTLPGHFEGKPGYTVVYTTEDDQNSVFNPRVLASGADTRYIKLCGAGETISLPDDAEKLREELRKYKGQLRLVVFDPIEVYLNNKVDGNSSKDVNHALATLNEIAAEFDCCILGIKHLNKASDTEVYNLVSGSTAYVTASRAVLMADFTEDFEDTGECSVGVVKGNAIRANSPAVRYKVNSADYIANAAECEGETGSTGLLSFIGESEVTQTQEINNRRIKTKKEREGKKESEESSKTNQARLWFTSVLARSGPMLYSELISTRDKMASAPTKSTLQKVMREYVQEEPRRKGPDSRYRLDCHWVEELVELTGSLPCGTVLVGNVYNGTDRIKPSPAAALQIRDYKEKQKDGLVDAYLEKLLSNP